MFECAGMGWPDPHPAVLSRVQGEKGAWKSSWAEIKTGTFCANCHHGRNRFDLKHKLNFLLKWS